MVLGVERKVLAAVDEEQWDCVLDFALLPYEVHIKLSKSININSGVIMRKLIQFLFGLSPIPVLSSFSQPRDIRERSTKVPF